MKKAFFIISLIILSVIIVSSEDYALDEVGEELKLYLGEVKIISVSNPTRIVIGNPNVADVINVSKNEITISPKATGTTTLVFWDIFGEQSYRVRVFTEDLSEIKRRIDNLLKELNLPEVYTQMVEDEGKVLLLGRVKNAQDRERISLILGSLKDKILDLIVVREESSVVEIDVQVLELGQDATKTLGFSFPDSITVAEPAAGTLRGTMDTIFRVFQWPRTTTFTATLNALVQEGKAKVLSRPRLACQSGKEAELLVGGEKPIFKTEVATGGGAGTSVDYKEYGIKLKIKPTVSEGSRIKLALNVEVSEVGAPETIGEFNNEGGVQTVKTATAKAYPLSKRTASTELFLMDGQTMAIGGLMKQKTEEDYRKTPGLADIPILGLLFRKKTTKIGGGTGEKGNVELFITLTPKIVSNIEATGQGKKEAGSKLAPYPMKEQGLPEPIAGYAQIIQRRILENLTYPDSAKEAGFQGTVKLSLHLSYQGELLQAILKESSGYKILDDQAISVAEDVVSYPPFPSSIEQNELWIDIPIDYRLD
jgi:pilus assembly protein CpaC